MSETKSEQERRQYFRVKNKLFMRYELLDPNGHMTSSNDFYSNETDSSNSSSTTSNKTKNKTSPQIALLRELKSIESENSHFKNTLSANESHVDTHLTIINDKLGRLSQQIISALSVNYSDLMEVDISGGGIRFESDHALNAEQKLQLELILMPQYFGIALFAKVVNCEALDSNEGFRIAIEFIEISETDRDAIIGHVFKTQSKILRANNKSEK